MKACEKDITNEPVTVIRDNYGDEGVYQGELLQTSSDSIDCDENDDLPHGMGTMKYADGRSYKGGWKEGHWQGKGKASFPNGDSYEGETKLDQRHGKGVYRWNDGRVYDGHFFEDQRNGQGIMSYPDGTVYDGNFKNGLRHGQGTYKVRISSHIL